LDNAHTAVNAATGADYDETGTAHGFGVVGV